MSDTNNCMYCGEIVPEGRMVCWKCEHGLLEANAIVNGAQFANLTDILTEMGKEIVDNLSDSFDMKQPTVAILVGTIKARIPSIIGNIMDKYNEKEIRNA